MKKITFANSRRWSGASRPATNRSSDVLEVGEELANVVRSEEVQVGRVDLGVAPRRKRSRFFSRNPFGVEPTSLPPGRSTR